MFNDWWQYDPSTNTWSLKASCPGQTRTYPTGFIINNLIYIGTGTNISGVDLSDFYEYDSVTDSWTQKTNYPPAGGRTIVASFNIGNIGYFGTGGSGGGYSVYNKEFWEYAPSSPPIASFQTSDSSICTNDCISFIDHSTNATSSLWSFKGANPSSSTDQNPLNICYLVPGHYDVTLIASNGVDNDTLTLTNYITVNPAPPTPFINQIGNKLFCSTDTNYVSYQWYYSNTIIPGAVDTFLVAAYNGNYNVSVTNKYGCSVAVGINVILGLTEADLDTNFNIYPNPVSRNLSVSILKPIDEAYIEIFNVLGEKIFFKAFNSPVDNHLTIDFDAYPKGIYILSLKVHGESVIKKIIKTD